MSPDNDTYRDTKTVGSLFSGIGGLDLGLERAGWNVVWQAETDSYASKVLTKHWPGVPNLGDVTKVEWEHVRRPDLVCGGFPCQPVSQAGALRAQGDERWLWPEFARCLRILRPEWALVENVAMLRRYGFGDIAADLAGLGYRFEWESIPAAAVGAPHLRWRVFVVAHAAGDGEPGVPVNANPGSGQLVPVADTERPGRGWAVDTVTAPGGSAVRREGHTVFGRCREPRRRSWWDVEPGVGRVANGVPARMDRLGRLGNAVVPQVAEWIGHRILEAAS